MIPQSLHSVAAAVYLCVAGVTQMDVVYGGAQLLTEAQVKQLLGYQCAVNKHINWDKTRAEVCMNMLFQRYQKQHKLFHGPWWYLQCTAAEFLVGVL